VGEGGKRACVDAFKNEMTSTDAIIDDHGTRLVSAFAL